MTSHKFDLWAYMNTPRPLEVRMARAIMEMFPSFEKNMMSINFVGSAISDSVYADIADFKAMLPQCKKIVDDFDAQFRTPIQEEKVK